MATKLEREAPPRLAYSIDDFAQATGLSRSHINREIKAGKIITIKSGNRRLIPAKFAVGYFEKAAA